MGLPALYQAGLTPARISDRLELCFPAEVTETPVQK